MPHQCTEDTMIGTQPLSRSNLLLANSDESSETNAGMFERCRAMFRTLGERMTSFDLSRQIYG